MTAVWGRNAVQNCKAIDCTSRTAARNAFCYPCHSKLAKHLQKPLVSHQAYGRSGNRMSSEEYFILIKECKAYLHEVHLNEHPPTQDGVRS